MFPSTADFLPLFSQDHSHREAVAGAERFRSQRHASESVSRPETRPVRRPHAARAG